MPYEVRKQGNQFCVYKEGGDKIACHDSQAQARRQQQALYAQERADESREFTAQQRKQAASRRQALPSGGFPIKNVQDLKNAIQAFGRAKDKAATKAHIIRRARALGATNLLPAGWTSRGDRAASQRIECPEDGCTRAFLHEDALADHAEAVHTFGDIQRMVSEAVRAKWGGEPTSKVWTYVEDLAEDWLVFCVEGSGDGKLYKASYAITDGAVTFGSEQEVRRRTVYEPVRTEAS